MKEKMRNNNQVVNRLLSHLAAEKKKAVLALCLIALMTFMWIKVFTRTAPKAAEAELIFEQMDLNAQSEPELKISFIELPQIAGRNDVITRDFFASDGWHDFVDGHERKTVGVGEVDNVSKDDQEVIRKVAAKLKLEAIVSSENPLAFINDKVLTVGDKLLVSDGIDRYECEVDEIKENTVVMRCRESRITLKLTQVN